MVDPRGSAESQYWDSVKDSNDPAQYEYYLQRYPNGIFADLAKRKRDVAVQQDQQKKQREAEKQDSDNLLSDNNQPVRDQSQRLDFRNVDPEAVKYCRQFNPDVFVECVSTYVMDSGNEQDDFYDPGPTRLGRTQMWYDNEFQYRVSTTGSSFVATEMSGQLTFRGEQGDYGIRFSIIGPNGEEVGRGRGTYADATHIVAEMSSLDGTVVGNMTLHVGHPAH